MNSKEQIYQLSFSNIYELEEKFKLIKEAFIKDNNDHKDYLIKNNIEFQEIDNCGVAVNVDTIPNNLKTKEVLDYFKNLPNLEYACAKNIISKVESFDLDKMNEIMFNTPIHFEPGYEGKLRDEFAGQILQGFVCKSGLSMGESFLIEKAYSLADEMLKQRKAK